MVTFRPVKKWIIPLLAVVIGFTIGFSFLPSKQEFHYNQWLKMIERLEKEPYEIRTKYIRDGATYSESEGVWSPSRANYSLKTPISDDTIFQFDVFLEEEAFFIYSANQWYKGETPHRIIQELSPLGQPFTWIKDILKEADEITKVTQGNSIIYKAGFQSFNDIEFQGVLLKEQQDTSLTLRLEDGELHSLLFQAHPIRPKEVPILNSYPESLTYEILFSPYEGTIPEVPTEALTGEELE